ncbi:MAG: methyltransferase domain-containing protein [Anaerolineales bacterium]|nr:methyltransferase domain-containing protein [Anaerolineales bacterium]
MSSIVLVILGLLVVLIGWEIWICEGAHLGRRFVVFLYELAAHRYDRIKGFDLEWEGRFLGEPIYAAISSLRDARLLDIGAGTGRLARALKPFPVVQRSLICVEPSRRMLGLGRSLSPSGWVHWMRAWAVPLPFESATFDMVISLEIIEFTPSPRDSLAEMVRVLRPGGWLVVTNRVGWEASLIFGKTFRRAQFPQLLESLGLGDVQVYPWQVDYDLAWARKLF